VQDMASAVQVAITLVSDNAAQSKAASSALAFAKNHQGATGRTLQALAAYLPNIKP
jgi:3-deoxy-D-manno-octulosonic-acid transferase